MSDVTHLLAALDAGDPLAASRLLPAVYDELRQMAAAQMAREQPGHTLDPTALVHEAYLRLIGTEAFSNRRHFFAAAAEAMRRILIDAARARRTAKRGGHGKRVPLDEERVLAEVPDEDLLALDEALELLAREEPEVAELVKLRYFAGLTVPRAAEVLGVAPRTADAWWAFARAWLVAKVRGDAV